MRKPEHHIFVCGGFRANGTPQGVCNKRGSMGLLQYMEQELSDRGLTDVIVSSAGCLKVCEAGPAMVVYPENWWYGHVEDEAAVDAIIDGLEEGRPAEQYIIS